MADPWKGCEFGVGKMVEVILGVGGRDEPVFFASNQKCRRGDHREARTRIGKNGLLHAREKCGAGAAGEEPHCHIGRPILNSVVGRTHFIGKAQRSKRISHYHSVTLATGSVARQRTTPCNVPVEPFNFMRGTRNEVRRKMGV